MLVRILFILPLFFFATFYIFFESHIAGIFSQCRLSDVLFLFSQTIYRGIDPSFLCLTADWVCKANIRKCICTGFQHTEWHGKDIQQHGGLPTKWVGCASLYCWYVLSNIFVWDKKKTNLTRLCLFGMQYALGDANWQGTPPVLWQTEGP